MTAHRDLDRQLSDFLRDGPTELPYESFDAVRDRTEQTGQRVVIGPWRLPTMNRMLAIGLGTAAVVVIGLFLGYQLVSSPTGDTRSGTTPSPTATASPTATPEPTASPVSAPPLSESFTSTQNGISISYPDGWTARAATEPWTDRTVSILFEPPTPYLDILYDPVLTDHLFLSMASQAIGDLAPEEWSTAQMASEEGCAATEPITVDGATGLIGGDGCDVAVVTSSGRGYWIQLLASADNPDAVAPYDRAWFEELLATVQLHPEDAVD